MNDSLLARLLWRLSLLSLILALFVTLVVVVQFRSTADTLRDRNLSGQANDIARHLIADADGRLQLLLPEPLRREYEQSAGMFVYRVIDEAGRAVLASDNSAVPFHPQEFGLPGAISYFRSDQPLDTDVRVFYGAGLTVQRGDAPYVIQVAQGPLHSDALVDEFFVDLWQRAGWVVAVAFVAVIVMIYVTVRASLAPIATAARDAADIGPQSLDRRIESARVPSEVKPLVEAFNKALDRISESYQKQREFTANAAHELRTPIAILRAHVDTLSDRSVARELSEDLGLLDRLVGQLLRLARADDLRVAAGSRAELNAVALEAAALMGPAAIAAGKLVAVNEAPHPVTVFGEGGHIGIALRNVIENALRATPEGTTVEVTVDPAGAVSVADRGPGVPEELRGRIFERFWRDNHAADGAGLGLSIVRRIVDAHGGRIDIADAASGGALVTLRFVV